MRRRAGVYVGIIAAWLAVGLGVASCGSSKSSSKPQPTATTGMASSVIGHGATISGTVNASGQSGVTYYFEYGPTTSYGTLTPAQPTSGNANQNVNATLSGLNANTTYHYELVVKTSSGQLNKGGDQTFTTTSVAGGITTSPPTTTGRVTTATTTTTTPRSTGYTTTPPPSTGYTTTPPPSTGYTTTPPPSTGYTTTPPSTSTHP